MKITRLLIWDQKPGYPLLFLVIFMLLFPTQFVKADIGPKPSMRFEFKYEIDPIPILGGQQIECSDETCISGEPLEEVGPQGFFCSEDECSSIAYMYHEYHKLVIEFADRTRESNVFTNDAYNAIFEVTVTEDTLIVKENRTLKNIFGKDLLCCSGILSTLVVETLVAGIFLAILQLPKAIIGFIPLASLVTLPMVWFVFPLLPVSTGLVIALAETTAILVEAVLIYFASLRRLSFPIVLLLSFIMNAASFAVGWIV